MIKVQHVSKNYGDLCVNNDISMEIKQGEIIGLVGPNGAGKTTLMKIITGIIKKYEGSLFMDDKNMKGYVNKKFEKLIGLVIEEPQLINNITGYDNLKYFHDFYIGSKYTNFDKEVQGIIENLEMQDFIQKKVKSYSLGMKQRLAIGVALLSSPRYLILDEPTNGMDRASTERILKYFKKLSMSGVGILISSHILEDISSSCNRVYALKKGEITHDIRFDDNENSGKKQILLEFSSIVEANELSKNKEIEVVYQVENQVLIKDNSRALGEINRLRESGVIFNLGQKSKMELFYEEIFGDEKNEN